jgi:hypothetical protein
MYRLMNHGISSRCKWDRNKIHVPTVIYLNVLRLEDVIFSLVDKGPADL